MKNYYLIFERWFIACTIIQIINLLAGCVILFAYVKLLYMLSVISKIEMIEQSSLMIIAYYFGATIAISFISFLFLSRMWDKYKKSQSCSKPKSEELKDKK